MDINWLITFKTIIETGSFTKAADRLGYAQSTVTFQIRQLEQELSVKLFDKIGRGVQLSEAGRQMLPQIDRAIEAISDLKTKKENIIDEYSGKLRVSIQETMMGRDAMQSLVSTFMKTAPKVDLQVHCLTCSDTREALLKGDLDLGVVYLDKQGRKAHPLIAETPLAEVPMVLVGSAAHPVAWDMGNGLPIKDQTCYFNEKKCVFHDMYEQYLNDHGITRCNTVAIGSVETQLDMVERGTGITFVPRYLAERRLRNGTLVELPMYCEDKTVYITYAVHRNKTITPAMSYLIELLEQHVSIDTLNRY